MDFEAFAYSAACTISPNTIFPARDPHVPGVIVLADEDDDGTAVLASQDGPVGPEGSGEIGTDAADAALAALGYRRVDPEFEEWREIKLAGKPRTGLWHCMVEKITAGA